MKDDGRPCDTRVKRILAWYTITGEAKHSTVVAGEQS